MKHRKKNRGGKKGKNKTYEEVNTSQSKKSDLVVHT